MEPTKMTVEEALKLGYERCLKDQETFAELIEDVATDELEENLYWLLEKEESPFQLSDKCLRDMLVDHVLNQSEVTDEDGELGDLVESIPLEEFAALTNLINKKLAEKVYWPNANIQLIP